MGFSFYFNCFFAYNELGLIVVFFFSFEVLFLEFLFSFISFLMLLSLYAFSSLIIFLNSCFFFVCWLFQVVHYLYNLFGSCISGQRACLVSADKFYHKHIPMISHFLMYLNSLDVFLFFRNNLGGSGHSNSELKNN